MARTLNTRVTEAFLITLSRSQLFIGRTMILFQDEKLKKNTRLCHRVYGRVLVSVYVYIFHYFCTGVLFGLQASYPYRIFSFCYECGSVRVLSLTAMDNAVGLLLLAFCIEK
jgi:hypothetical protein